MNVLKLCAARIAALLAVSLSTWAAEPVPAPLVSLSNPPPVQMLVPGFTVRELPLVVNNINNFAYAGDGRLFALCYDGNVLQLKDTDGDGLEDSVTYFFRNTNNQIGTCTDIAWSGNGLFIPTKSRVVFLRDLGNGTSRLETVTTGWRPRSNPIRDFDGSGVAVDPEGNLYFGLAVDNSRNAYLVNTNTGKPGYTVDSERGSILVLAPNTSKWKQYASGFRYTVALEFNSHGDLFATDQEGATWLANGNPFDELLHVQAGRHYGFPPRHPQYLPNVIDEPSVFNYGPQHQSTCSLHFNDPLPGSTNMFGPRWWRGDALITGESRGKIYRTKLVKTPAGYVGQNQIIACLTNLAVEAAPTPQGDLLVAVHAGAPDWGIGPQAKGRLFKITYNQTAPQPVLAFPGGPTETIIVFDRPLTAAQAQQLARNASVVMGTYVSTGDRFEKLRPGYQVVQDQLSHPRFELPVINASVTPDNRSLILRTAKRTEAVKYAITLLEGSEPRAHDTARRELEQQAAMDLLTDLTGLEAVWQDAQGRVQWSGWLPHPDLTVARELTAASKEHERLFGLLKTPGSLRVRGQFDLYYMLHPPTQPGSTLNYEYPPEKVTIGLKANGSLKLTSGAEVRQLGDTEARLSTVSKPGEWVSFELTLATGNAEPKLDLWYYTREDTRPRALPLHRTFVPWATPRADIQPMLARREIPEIAGGDWARGKALFFSDQVACFKCHQVDGEGGTIAPDLSNLVHRDYASVLRDILEPSAALDPDYLAYDVETKEGESYSGVLVDHTTSEIVLGRADGTRLRIPETQVESMKASTISLMPQGLFEGLNEQQRRDLMTFLLTRPEKPEPMLKSKL